MYDLSRELERINVVSEISDCERYLTITLNRKHSITVLLVDGEEGQLDLFERAINSLDGNLMFKKDYLEELVRFYAPDPHYIARTIGASIDRFVDIYKELKNLNQCNLNY